MVVCVLLGPVSMKIYGRFAAYRPRTPSRTAMALRMLPGEWHMENSFKHIHRYLNFLSA
jgi:hypothetical protein